MYKSVISSEISNQLYVLKAMSILSVICAHMRIEQDGYVNRLIDRLYASIGVIGVICFLFLSGFFYNQNEDIKIFWKKKIKSIVIPWLFCSFCTYIILSILTKNINMVEYIKWVIGAGTWYYFVTIIIACFIIYRFIKNDLAIYSSIVIGLISIILTTKGYISYGEWFTPYLNVFNWIPFFSLGVICKKKLCISDIQIFIEKNIFYIIIVFSLILVLSILGIESITYWGRLSIPFEIISLMLFIYLSNKLKKNHLMIDIGKKSFSIYLIHMQIVGIINRRVSNIILFNMIKGLIGLFVTYIIILVIEKLAYKLKMEKLLTLIGLR